MFYLQGGSFILLFFANESFPWYQLTHKLIFYFYVQALLYLRNPHKKHKSKNNFYIEIKTLKSGDNLTNH